VADRQTLNAANIDLLNSVSSSTPWIWDWASALFAFRAKCGPIMGVSVRTHHIKAVDVAEIGEVAKIGDCKPVAGATSRLLDRYQPR
jgi:hypothetical protein